MGETFTEYSLCASYVIYITYYFSILSVTMRSGRLLSSFSRLQIQSGKVHLSGKQT